MAIADDVEIFPTVGAISTSSENVGKTSTSSDFKSRDAFVTLNPYFHHECG